MADSPVVVKDRSALLRMAGNIAPAVFAEVVRCHENGIKEVTTEDLDLVAYVSLEVAKGIRDRMDDVSAPNPKEEGEGGEA